MSQTSFRTKDTPSGSRVWYPETLYGMTLGCCLPECCKMPGVVPNKIPVYYNVFRLTSTKTVVRYVTFYDFNPVDNCAACCFSHEGDIEHVTCYLRNTPSFDQVWLDHVYYSAHGDVDGTYVSNCKGDQLSNVDVYVAKGSHAMYPTSGCQPRIFGCGNDYTTGNGVVTTTSNTDLIHLPLHSTLNWYVQPIYGRTPCLWPSWLSCCDNSGVRNLHQKSWWMWGRDHMDDPNTPGKMPPNATCCSRFFRCSCSPDAEPNSDWSFGGDTRVKLNLSSPELGQLNENVVVGEVDFSRQFKEVAMRFLPRFHFHDNERWFPTRFDNFYEASTEMVIQKSPPKVCIDCFPMR